MGIAPYAKGGIFRSTGPDLMFYGSRPSSVRAFGPATFPVGEGDLPAGDALFQSALDP